MITTLPTVFGFILAIVCIFTMLRRVRAARYDYQIAAPGLDVHNDAPTWDRGAYLQGVSRRRRKAFFVWGVLAALAVVIGFAGSAVAASLQGSTPVATPTPPAPLTNRPAGPTYPGPFHTLPEHGR